MNKTIHWLELFASGSEWIFLLFLNLWCLLRSSRPQKRDSSCDRHTKHGREELPHVRGQGQKPGGPHARRAVAKRSYPTSEVRGSGQECQAAMVQERQRRATLCLRSGVAAGRSHPTPPRGRPGVEAGRTNPRSKKWWLHGRRRA